MASFKRYIQNLPAITLENSLFLGDSLRPPITGQSPGLLSHDWVKVGTSKKAYRVETNPGDTLEYRFVPPASSGPWTVILRPLEGGVPPIRLQHTGYAHVSRVLDSPYGYIVLVQDANGGYLDVNECFFESVVVEGGTWTSRAVQLSPMLLSTDVLELEAQGNWTLEVATATGSYLNDDWSTSLPDAATILEKDVTGLQFRVSCGASASPEDEVTALVVHYSEAYATQPPSLPAKHEDSTLYQPRLRVLIDRLVNVTPFVTSFTGGSLGLIVPDNRYDALLLDTSSVTVELDGNPAFAGRITDVQRSEFATGIQYQLSCTALFELLAGKMDEDILGPDTDGDGKPELPFYDDGGYLSFVAENMPGLGAPPLFYPGRPWRPIEAWFQGGEGNSVRKLVQLDSDYDWYQLYSTQNQSVRGKLRDVANANLYDFASVGGYPAVLPMLPNEDKPLTEAATTVFNVTASGAYVPEARLFVPDYHYSPAGLPKSVSVSGLATTDGAELTDGEVEPIHWLHDEDGPKDEFKIETGRGLPAIFWFTDADGLAAVVSRSGIEISERIEFDWGGFGSWKGKYRLVEASENPDYVPGYGGEGIIGIEMDFESIPWSGLGSYTIRMSGYYLYSASGDRGEPPKAKAEGSFLPEWARYPKNLVLEMSEERQALPKDDEVVENSFLTSYYLPKDDTELAAWNNELTGAGRAAIYGKDEQGYYATLAGVKLHSRALSELADALALQRVLRVLSIELKYVGHPGLKKGDIFGIARRPAKGLYAAVEQVDYFMVLEDFSVNFTAGGEVSTSMQAGYVGTHYPLADETTRDVRAVSWQEPEAPIDEVLYF